MRWKRLANFVAAVGLALGSHYVSTNDTVTAVADLIAVLISQNNGELTRPKDDRRRSQR